jgi:hypothetical protein
MVRPSAGAPLFITSRSAVVIRGGKKPEVVLLTSKAAEASGVTVPTPTCAILVKLAAINAAHNKIFFII